MNIVTENSCKIELRYNSLEEGDLFSLGNGSGVYMMTDEYTSLQFETGLLVHFLDSRVVKRVSSVTIRDR